MLYEVITARDVATDFYPASPRAALVERPVAERIAQPDLEVHETLAEDAFLQEADRCFSCGQCHGCQYCFMYCNGGGFVRVITSYSIHYTKLYD